MAPSTATGATTTTTTFTQKANKTYLDIKSSGPTPPTELLNTSNNQYTIGSKHHWTTQSKFPARPLPSQAVPSAVDFFATPFDRPVARPLHLLPWLSNDFGPSGAWTWTRCCEGRNTGPQRKNTGPRSAGHGVDGRWIEPWWELVMMTVSSYVS